MPLPEESLVPVTEDPPNAETPLSALLEPITPARLVYVRNHFPTPSIDAAAWRLTVDGAVEQPLTLGLEDLRDLPTRTVTMTLECAGNGRTTMRPKPPGTPWGYGAVSVARFTGTPLSGVLDRAGVDRRAVEILFRAADAGEVEPGRQVRFARSLPVDAASGPDPLLAWELDGEPLSPDHGFPLRLVAPGWYGMASVKWLEEILAVAEPFDGYFQKEHYVYSEDEIAAEGEPVTRIRPRSLIVSPEEGATLAAGTTVVRGVAWSGHGPVTRVEVSDDGGARWELADLETAAGRYGAQRWSYHWTPATSGEHTLLSRATDAAGDGQPPAHRWNRLGYGNNGPHQVTVRVD